jgi:hypothetical protein
MVGAALLAAVAAPSCGGDVTVDPDGESSGRGGATSTTGTPAGPSPVGVTSSSGNVAVGVGGSGGGPAQVSAVSSGMPPCTSCAEEIEPPGGDGEGLCPGSQALYDAIGDCLCVLCEAECECADGISNGSCEPCVQAAAQSDCSDEVIACIDDV